MILISLYHVHNDAAATTT